MPPSSNWLKLRKNLKGATKNQNERPRKRQKVQVGTLSERMSEGSVIDIESEQRLASTSLKFPERPMRDSVSFLRNMVSGRGSHPPAQLLPGKYLAIDCEMVGIAGDPSMRGMRDQGDESSLARVSVVNYHGAVQLDVFVRQRERVTDWRTAVSGVRESDMINAKSFSEVQRLVADLLKDRILVGHAVHNDLKVLLLSHPHNMTRDTQMLAGRHGTLIITKRPDNSSAAGAAPTVGAKVNRRPALRKLVIQELGIDIQAGEHSSVIDARATMAIYRLHRKTWDQGFMTINRIPSRQKETELERITPGETARKSHSVKLSSSETHKRSRDEPELVSDDDVTAKVSHKSSKTSKIRSPVSTKMGISSGLSIVVKRRVGRTKVKQIVSRTRGEGNSAGKNTKWWGELGE